MYIYIYTYIHTYIHTYTYIYIHIHTYTYIYIHIHTYTYIYIHIYMLPPPPKAHRFHDFRHILARYCSASTLRRHQAARTQEAGTLARTPTLGSRTTGISGSCHGTGISLSLLLVKICNIPYVHTEYIRADTRDVQYASWQTS